MKTLMTFLILVIGSFAIGICASESKFVTVDVDYGTPKLHDHSPFHEIEVDHDNHANVPTQCATDLNNLVSSMSEEWAKPLLDSYGKPGSGILRGNLFWPGNYDQCMSFEASKLDMFPLGFKGRYCLASISMKNSGLSVKTGICIPNTCTSADLSKEALIKLISKVPIFSLIINLDNLPDVKANCLPDTSIMKAKEFGLISILCLVVALSLMGTGYDIFKRYTTKSNELQINFNASSMQYKVADSEISMVDHTEKINASEPNIPTSKLFDDRDKRSVGKALLCFSVLKNGEAILDTSVRQGQFNNLHGIRVVSMTWIILGHTFVLAGMQYASNTADISNEFKKWTYRAISNATYAVDTFFLMSGFLLTYLFVKDGSSFTIKKLGVFYLHRYIRLTPVYALIVYFGASLFNFMGSGPYWPYDSQESNICTKYWWQNLLYINNLFDGTTYCISWSWYLSNDIQFFIISPLFLVLLKSQRRMLRYAGLALIFALILTSWIVTFFIVDKSVRPPSNGTTTNSEIYDKPWTRIGPYLIGCLFGFFILKLEGKRNFLSMSWNAVLWSVAIGLSLVDIYGEHNSNMGIITKDFYFSLNRSAWAIAIGWVMFACITGHGGPVDKFLSWRFWLPLSRLTYCAYLSHPLIMMYYFQRLRNPLHVTNDFVAIHFLGFTVLTYGVSFLMSILFESPIIRLEKLLK